MIQCRIKCKKQTTPFDKDKTTDTLGEYIHLRNLYLKGRQRNDECGV